MIRADRFRKKTKSSTFNALTSISSLHRAFGRILCMAKGEQNAQAEDQIGR